MNLFQKLFDERFFEHRRRSTSLAGVTAGFVATGLFGWRYFIEHRWSQDLFVVVLVLVVVKVAMMTWYTLTD
jgi:hypothetical protein